MRQHNRNKNQKRLNIFCKYKPQKQKNKTWMNWQVSYKFQYPSAHKIPNTTSLIAKKIIIIKNNFLLDILTLICELRYLFP